MGIMAGRAPGAGHRIIHVRLCKILPVRFVAAKAERSLVILEEVIRFCRSVGIMAVDAALLNRAVLEFCLADSITHILVAVKAKIICCLDKVELIIRGVGVMTVYTISFRNNFVDTLCFLRYQSLMALNTDFICLRCKQFTV
jgi:hypothetical protein